MTSMLVERSLARSCCSPLTFTFTVPGHLRPLIATASLSTSQRNWSSKPSIMTAKRSLSSSPKSDSQDKSNKQAKMSDGQAENGGSGEQAHQYQAGDSTHREEDQWKFKAPYKIHDDGNGFEAKWKGKCHCGKVQYELSREKPLASKYCHCTTCQRLHGVGSSTRLPAAVPGGGSCNGRGNGRHKLTAATTSPPSNGPPSSTRKTSTSPRASTTSDGTTPPPSRRRTTCLARCTAPTAGPRSWTRDAT